MSSIFSSDQQKWKKVGDYKYAIDFPCEWIMTERHDHPSNIPDFEGTGPRFCSNCRYYGCDEEGIFQAYCLNCADYVYRGERGEGRGIEVLKNTILQKLTKKE